MEKCSENQIAFFLSATKKNWRLKKKNSFPKDDLLYPEGVKDP